MASKTDGVDKTNFKICEQSSFCKRCRSMEPEKSSFEFLTDKASVSSSVLKSELIDTKYNVKYGFYLYAVEGDIFRLKINELNPVKQRFEVPFVLVSDPILNK